MPIMRRIVLALLLSACASTPFTGEATLPTKRTGDFFLVSCTIDGRGPYDLVLDTGSDWLVLDPSVPRGRVVRAGPIERRGVGTQVRPMGALSEALGVHADGILPYDFFRDVLLTIDYPASEVRVSGERLESGTPTDAFEVRPFVEVVLQGRSYRMLVDTGSGAELAVGAPDGIEWAVEPREIGRARMIDRVRVRRAGRASGQARVDELVVERPMVDIGVDVPRVGARLLRGARISFDQRSLLVSVRNDAAHVR